VRRSSAGVSDAGVAIDSSMLSTPCREPDAMLACLRQK
jgi:hypothetical protein